MIHNLLVEWKDSIWQDQFHNNQRCVWSFIILTSITGLAGGRSAFLILTVFFSFLTGLPSSPIINSLKGESQRLQKNIFSTAFVSRRIIQHVVSLCIPVVPVCLFVGVELWDVHVFALPGCLVIGQISPFDQVMIDVLFINTDVKRGNTQERWSYDKVLSLFALQVCMTETLSDGSTPSTTFTVLLFIGEICISYEIIYVSYVWLRMRWIISHSILTP